MQYVLNGETRVRRACVFCRPNSVVSPLLVLLEDLLELFVS